MFASPSPICNLVSCFETTPSIVPAEFAQRRSDPHSLLRDSVFQIKVIQIYRQADTTPPTCLQIASKSSKALGIRIIFQLQLLKQLCSKHEYKAVAVGDILRPAQFPEGRFMICQIGFSNSVCQNPDYRGAQTPIATIAQGSYPTNKPARGCEVTSPLNASMNLANVVFGHTDVSEKEQGNNSPRLSFDTFPYVHQAVPTGRSRGIYASSSPGYSKCMLQAAYVADPVKV